MEILVAFIAIVLSFGFLLKEATNFVRQLKTNKTAKLSKGFEAKLSIVPIDKKKRRCRNT